MSNIGGIIKTLQNIMRKDQGVSGDAQPLNVKIVDIRYGIESAYFCIDIRPFI